MKMNPAERNRTETLAEDLMAEESMLGRMTGRIKAAYDSRVKTKPDPKSTATTLPKMDDRSSIPPPPANDQFYKKIMGGALAIVLERPEITEKIWGVRGKERQYAFFRMIYDPATRASVMKRLLNGFKSVFCGENTLNQNEWIKVLNVANQLSSDKVIPVSLMNKMVKLYQYQVQGKKTPENIDAIHDVCLNEDTVALGKLLW